MYDAKPLFWLPSLNRDLLRENLITPRCSFIQVVPNCWKSLLIFSLVTVRDVADSKKYEISNRVHVFPNRLNFPQVNGLVTALDLISNIC